MKKPLDMSILDFLSPDITNEQRAALTVSYSGKVPVVCSQCHVTRTLTFFSVYRQRRARGAYVCRSCQSKVNGALAPRGFERRKRTNLERYGVEHPMQLPEVRDRMYATNRERYGVSRVLESPIFQDVRKQTEMARFGGHPFSNPLIREKIATTNLQRYGVENPGAARQTSRAENEVRMYLQTLTGEMWPSRWDIIPPRELDGYNDTRQAAFEYCGLFWHAEPNKTRHDHYGKLRACQARNVRLFTIFEDEWSHKRQQVQYILAAQLGIFERRAYARCTTVVPLAKDVASRTLADWHLQGAPSQVVYAWGLLLEHELVGVMSFCHHHRQNVAERTLVLSRMAFKPGYQIIGGASKMWQAAIATLQAANVMHVVSWSDNRWSTGGVYQALGFTLDARMGPDYSYVTPAGLRLSKQSCTREKLGAVEGQTERQRADELAYRRIWDCGKLRWVYAL